MISSSLRMPCATFAFALVVSACDDGVLSRPDGSLGDVSSTASDRGSTAPDAPGAEDLAAPDLPAADLAAPDGPTADGPTTDGPTADGPAADGPAADGPTADAQPLDSVAPTDGPVADGSPTAPRFPGDPGPGQIYVGFIAEGGNFATHAAEETNLSTVNYGAGAKTRHTGIARLFTPDWDWKWTLIDKYTAAGKLVWWSFKPTGGTEAARSAFMADVAAGNHDGELTTWANEIKSRAPIVFWYTFHHEPENDYGASTTADTASKQNYRAAARHIRQLFRAQGVSNVAYAATTYMQDTFFSQDRPWYHYYPDWKGTSYTGGYNNPNAADFFSGADSVVDLVGFDAYCFHGQGGPGSDQCTSLLWSWSQATYESHDMYSNDVNKHARKLIDTIKKLGKPLAIGEWGYHLFSPGGAVDPAVSRNQLEHVYQDFVANDIVGVVHWMAVAPSSDHAYEFGLNCVGASDPTDARRKAFSWWLDRPSTVLPSWANP